MWTVPPRGMLLAHLLPYHCVSPAAGFTKGWQLALVMLSVVPLLGISAGLLFRSIGQLTQLGQKLYAEVRATHTFLLDRGGRGRRKVDLPEAFGEQRVRGCLFCGGPEWCVFVSVCCVAGG